MGKRTDNTTSKLLEIRLARGLTQRQIAEPAGITRETISMIETGKFPHPRLRTARAIARALDLAVDDVFPE